MTSSISGFYRLSMAERRARIGEIAGLDQAALSRLEAGQGLHDAQADRMVENALGVFGLPLGVCVNLQINGRDVLAPMVVEEPSVVAACSYAAKLLRAGGGVEATCSAPILVGQIQLLDVPDPVLAERAILGGEEELLALANQKHLRLRAAGGGARSLSVRPLPATGTDPCGDMLIVHIAVDVQDAMGANAVNSMCERIAPRLADLAGGRTALRILSNLADQRTVTVIGRVPFAALEGKGAGSGEQLAKRIEEASVFAERDPYRACTHNKGIMNGVDAVLIALGQDWRAVEAGAHAYAARSGRYTAMASWRAEDGHLVGRMTIPLAVGTVGGVASSHPVVPVARTVAGIEHATDVAELCAAAGLAQNLGALRALAAEGIQHGHMRLHARNIAVEAGAEEHEVLAIATRIADAGKVNTLYAEQVIAEFRRPAADEKQRPACTSDIAPRPTATRRARPLTPETPREPFVSGPSQRASSEPLTLSGLALVTGATGHLGSLLVRRLLSDGVPVRALVEAENLAAENTAAQLGLMGAEIVRGDLSDRDTAERAVAGCQVAFHCDTQRGGDVRPTSSLLAAAADANMERVLVATQMSPRALPTENIALAACLDGQDIVLVASPQLLGSSDLTPESIGAEMVEFANARPRAIPPQVALVGADDAVEAHLRAMTRGRRGRRYSLIVPTLARPDLLAMFEEVSGQPRAASAPDRRGLVHRAQKRLLGGLAARFFPPKNQIPRAAPPAELVETDRMDAWAEFDLRPRSAREAVHDTYLELARLGLVPARAGTTTAPITEHSTSREQTHGARSPHQALARRAEG